MIQNYVPRLFEKVAVNGRNDLFLVISVDEKTQRADLMQLSHISNLLDSVPFLALRPHRQEVPLESA